MRKSFVELRAQIAAAFPDNTAGAITPAAVRTYLLDALNAIQPAYGSLRRANPAVITANITPAVKATWQSASDSDSTQTTSSPTTGDIARSERGTCAINFTADMECANGRFVTFTLFRNGIATSWAITGNGGGAGNPIAVALTAVDYADPAAAYDIRVTAEVANVAVTLSNMALILEVLPVNTF